VKKQTWIIFLELPDYNNRGKADVLLIINIKTIKHLLLIFIIIHHFFIH
jgi:hypothetical protein